MSALQLSNYLAVGLDNAIGDDLAALDRYLALLRQRQEQRHAADPSAAPRQERQPGEQRDFLAVHAAHG
jgi:hypothetical protein